MPKSAILALPRSSNRILLGFRSLHHHGFHKGESDGIDYTDTIDNNSRMLLGLKSLKHHSDVHHDVGLNRESHTNNQKSTDGDNKVGRLRSALPIQQDVAGLQMPAPQ